MQVVVADDSLLFREGLVRVLEAHDFDVVAQTDNAEDLVRRVGGLRPDVVLVDIRMPPSHTDEGLRAAQAIRGAHPEIGVVVLSQYLESSYALRLLEEGSSGCGYLLKDRIADIAEFADAVRRVGEGGSVVDPQVIAALVQRPADSDRELAELTPREREILALMAEGRSNAGICERLVLSRRTVESYVRTIFHKLGLAPADDDHRRVLAVLTYLRAR
ncbi:MAG: response regulator transcription factor [Actinomycetota bacterium]|nr:response regulator transcription factor [Actinomycetota bacterium]